MIIDCPVLSTMMESPGCIVQAPRFVRDKLAFTPASPPELHDADYAFHVLFPTTFYCCTTRKRLKNYY